MVHRRRWWIAPPGDAPWLLSEIARASPFTPETVVLTGFCFDHSDTLMALPLL